MRYAEFFHLKPVQVALLIVVLAGVFLLGRCSGPEPVVDKEPEIIQPETVIPDTAPAIAEEETGHSDCRKKIQFYKQYYGFQWDEDGFTYRVPQSEECITTIYREYREYSEYRAPEQKRRFSRPVILLKPSWKKKRVEPPGNSVKEVFSDLFLGYDKAACAGDLVPAVWASVAALEARSILYGIGPFSDCSGIFHRVLMGVKKRCPDHEYPLAEQYRNSRELARWYHEQGELILIKDVLRRTDLIRPGMVLFYGRGGSVYSNFTVDDLVSTRAGIDHLGVVVSVARDKAGEVASYKLFHGHGRKGKTAASVTNWHKRTPTRAGYPPFGNGRQQLLAAARIVRPEVTEASVEPVKLEKLMKRKGREEDL
jgi:hypothetical protein